MKRTPDVLSRKSIFVQQRERLRFVTIFWNWQGPCIVLDQKYSTVLLRVVWQEGRKSQEISKCLKTSLMANGETKVIPELFNASAVGSYEQKVSESTRYIAIFTAIFIWYLRNVYHLPVPSNKLVYQALTLGKEPSFKSTFKPRLEKLSISYFSTVEQSRWRIDENRRAQQSDSCTHMYNLVRKLFRE